MNCIVSCIALSPTSHDCLLSMMRLMIDCTAVWRKLVVVIFMYWSMRVVANVDPRNNVDVLSVEQNDVIISIIYLSF